MRSRAPLICFFAIICAASAAAAPAKPVYRVDGATATIKHHRLIVRARGAVRTGGWATPRLRVREGFRVGNAGSRSGIRRRAAASRLGRRTRHSAGSRHAGREAARR